MTNATGSARARLARAKRVSGWTAAAVMFLSAILLMMPDTVKAQEYRFSAVEISGNQRIEAATILTYTDIERGERVTAAQLNDAYQRLVGSGLFETVEIEPRGNTLAIRVQEFPTINRINIEGNRRLKDEDLETLLQSKPRRVYSPSVAEADAQIITEAYEQAGRFAATVTPKIIRRSDNRVDLVFEVAEGRVSEVERISFVGNRAYSDRRLRRAIGSKQAGLLRGIISSDTFIADRIEFDKQLLSDFYSARGYIDFEVLSVTSELARSRDAFFVTFNIREGQQWRFGEITTSSDLPDVDTDVFQDALRLDPGDIYSPTLVERNIARLERLAVEQGLDFIRVDPRITRNDRDLTLDVEFQVVRGPRIFVERIDIEGNTTTLDRVIRREFTIVEGDPFNPREIRQAAERIRALRFFENVEVEARDGSSSDLAIIDVDVEERPTGSLTFGASYARSEGLGFTAAFSERNFLGRGQSIGLAISTTSENQASSFTFTEPALLGRDLELGLELSYATSDSDNSDTFFNTRVAAFSPSLTFPVGENSRLQLRYRIAEENVLDVNPGASEVLQREEARGALFNSSIGYAYTYDTRRTGLNPNAGVFLRFSQDFAGVGGDVEYLRTEFLAGAETKVWNEEVTLRAIFESGYLHMLSDNSRIIDRFNISGRRMRGFDTNGLGPRDLNATVQDGLGGNIFAVARFESQFPLGLPDEYGLSGGTFFDVGSVWDLDDNIGTGGIPIDDDFKLRAVIGVSLFWESALGPLRFNFSHALKKEDFDREQSFDFTISTRF